MSESRRRFSIYMLLRGWVQIVILGALLWYSYRLHEPSRSTIQQWLWPAILARIARSVQLGGVRRSDRKSATTTVEVVK